jgi:hypothetical protein
MAIHTHTHTTDHTAPVVVRSGYRTYDGAHRWMRTHEAPSGHCYGAQATPGTDTYEIVCDTIDGQSDGTVPTPPPAPTYTDEPIALRTRYGVAITTVDAARSFIQTADGYGYASPMPGHDTYGAPTVPAHAATPTFDTDLAPVRIITNTTPQAAGATMTPYTTYTGTTSLARYMDGVRSTCTDYTAIAGGGIVTRTYTYDDGTYVTTRTDVNHAWVATDDGTGDTITYVAADHAYYRTYARNLEATLVTAVSWAQAGAPTCSHTYAGYGACIAPFGHTHAEHIDANGNEFTGTSHRFNYGELGPVAPATYTRVVTRVPMHRDTYRTVLRVDVAAMVHDYTDLMAAFGHPFRTDGQAYAALVIGMPYDTYEPANVHYPAYSDTLDAHYSI